MSSIPDSYDRKITDKVLFSKFRYNAIVSHEGLFYQGLEKVLPSIWTYNDNSLDRLMIEIMCQQLEIQFDDFNTFYNEEIETDRKLAKSNP